jgi:hypothetical protein
MGGSEDVVGSPLRGTIDPSHIFRIDEFQVLRQGVVTTSLSKAELQSAGEAEIESLTRDEELDLDIENAAWRRNLAALQRWKDNQTSSTNCGRFPISGGRWFPSLCEVFGDVSL